MTALTNDQPTQQHLGQLEKCREGILDEQARPEDRRRWVELLLSYSSPQADCMVVELLGLARRPQVQRTLCEAMTDSARSYPARLHVGFVEPLVALLGADDPALRHSAARALAEYPGGEVPVRLREIAADSATSLTKRVAAIDALAPNTHRREVVRQLISLLDSSAPEITDRVILSLEPVAPGEFGSDLQRWRDWWVEKNKLDDKTWLAEQLQIYRDHSRRLADELDSHRSRANREQAAVTAQMRRFQRELFRALNSEQRQAKLVEWLETPVAVVQLTALAIIKARVADEGKRPVGEVQSAMLRLLRQGSAAGRLEVLLILQTLGDPTVVPAVLEQLAYESDPAVRNAIFKAIGKLQNAQAVPALIREIDDDDALPECVREAAIALGEIAGRIDAETTLQDSVDPLKRRYESVTPQDVALRAALLTAMAGVGDPAFTPELLDAVESDDPTILQPAIRGLRAIGDTSKLRRFRTLMAHPDPFARLAAIEAVAQLGREDADLESLLLRLNPTIEQNELAREAAWRGFREFLASRSIQERIDTAQRLRDTPDLQTRYLEELADALPTQNGTTDGLEAVTDRLAALLIAQGKHAEAVPRLRQLYELRIARRDPAALDSGLRWLESSLQVAAPYDVVAAVMRLREQAVEEGEQERIIDALTQYLDSPSASEDPERLRSILTELQETLADTRDYSWPNLLLQLSAKLESVRQDDSSESTP